MKLSRAIVVTTIATVLPLFGAAHASAETAYPAAAFNDSIGVNTKLAAPQTAYYNRGWWDRQNTNEKGASAAGNVKTLLQSLGIKHIRYDFCSPKFPNCVRGNETAKLLYDQLGVRTLDDYYGTSTESIKRLGTPAGIEQEIDENLKVAADATGAGGTGPIEALEGPNEYDRHSGKYADWAARVAHAQALANEKINGSALSSKLSPMTLLPAPLGVPNNNLAATNKLTTWGGNATFRAWDKAPLDAANQHFYSYFDCPENAVMGATVNASCTGVNMPKVQCPTWQNPIWLNCANQIAGADKPVWVTEAGYTTSLDSLEGMSGGVAASYLPRLLLEAWRQQAEPGRRQWARTYLYELIDSRDGRHCGGWNCAADREAGHGLANVNYGLKQQGRALKRLLTTLSDPGAPVTGASTATDVSVAPSDQAQVRRLLFRKSDGKLVLAIWRPVKLWTNGSRNWWGGMNRGKAVAEGAPVNTTITLPSALPIAVDRPSIDTATTEMRGASTTHVVPARGDVTLVTIG